MTLTCGIGQDGRIVLRLEVYNKKMTLTYDLHIHSCLSPCGDDDMTPENIAGMAKVLGLDVIALTDHNSCKNCPALKKAAEKYGIIVLFGMELCTVEEVHVLCYFPTLDDALSFDSLVYSRIPHVRNTPAIFGNQFLYDENDRIAGSEEKLLISATRIPFDSVYDLAAAHHGIMVPAHIDRPSYSLLGNLGFIPPESRFTCAEVKNTDKWDSLQRQYPHLQTCSCLCSSDAHTLAGIHEPLYTLHPREASAEAVLEHISQGFS